MLQLIKTPLGKMSYVGDFHLDTDMKGKHYSMVALGDENGYEHLANAILTDLMQEDPKFLTLEEFYYCFMVVKVASLGPQLNVNVTCANKVLTQTNPPRQLICGHRQKFSFGLNEADVHYLPVKFEAPKIKLVTSDGEQEFIIRPPRMCDEIDLINTYLEQGVERKDFVNPEKPTALSVNYTKERFLLHLTTKDEKITPYSDKELRDKLLSDLDNKNTYRTLQELSEKVGSYSAFGVQHKIYVAKCEGCGRNIAFRLPLHAGLSL